MLIKRTLTALILAPIAIAGILLLNKTWFSVVLGLILIIASWEYCRLVSITSPANKAFFTIAILVLAFVFSKNTTLLAPLLFLALTWWFVVLYWVIKYPDSHASVSKNIYTSVINCLLYTSPSPRD